jgi:thymidylate synthase
MNNIEQQYLDLVKDILENGYTKGDRTGTGTKSVFGRTIRHSMKDGFPLLTTKKMAFKTMVTELLWFLRGSTNIKYLVDNGCHIWDGDAYKNYRAKSNDIDLPENLFNKMIDDLNENSMFPIDNPNKMLSQEEFINKIKTDDDFAKKFGELGPAYGKQWRRWRGQDGMIGEKDENGTRIITWNQIDQIANAIHLLKTDPDSRRILVNAWNVADLPDQVLPPCHYSFQFYTRELTWEERVQWAMKNINVEWENLYIVEEIAKLTTPKRAISLIWSQRSVDVGLGLPFNIASYALLLEIIAKEVNMIPEEVIGNLGDCHIYLNHVDGLKEQSTRTPYELPTVKISDRAVNDISEYTLEDFTLENYKYHPAIKLPLSN